MSVDDDSLIKENRFNVKFKQKTAQAGQAIRNKMFEILEKASERVNLPSDSRPSLRVIYM